MAHRIDDRWLWLGVGVAAFLTVKGIQYAFKDLISLTKIDPYQYEPKKKKADYPEDTLTVAELEVLANSPHTNIANAAISIIIERAARTPAVPDMLARDLDCTDPETKRRAHEAVHFIRNFEAASFDGRGIPLSPPGYTSPTQWSERWEPSDDEDGRISPLAGLRDELLGGNGGIVPSIENPVAGWEDVPRARRSNGLDEDGDDAETRRRRREAMVLHEGAGAVTGEDIIRPRETE